MRALGASLLLLFLLPGCASPPAEDGSPATGVVEPLFPDVHGLAYDATTGTLHVATHTGLMRRVGEGAWERLGPSQDLMGFSPDPRDASVFYASGHPATGGNLGAIRSTDGGATWTRVGAEGADFHAMIATEDALYGYTRGIVHRSLDGGVTWEAASQQPVSAFAWAGGRLFAATTSDVRASDDRGATWTTVGTVRAQGLSAAGADVLYAGVLGGLQKSTDGGRTWSSTSLDADERIIGHVNVAKGDADIVHAASYDGAVWRSDDAGATWVPVRRA